MATGQMLVSIAGPLMNLGDVSNKSVPKMMLVAPPRAGGAICVRSFIPHRAHASIGVLGAVSVATACLIAGSPAAALAVVSGGQRKTVGRRRLRIGLCPLVAEAA